MGSISTPARDSGKMALSLQLPSGQLYAIVSSSPYHISILHSLLYFCWVQHTVLVSVFRKNKNNICIRSLSTLLASLAKKAFFRGHLTFRCHNSLFENPFLFPLKCRDQWNPLPRARNQMKFMKWMISTSQNHVFPSYSIPVCAHS